MGLCWSYGGGGKEGGGKEGGGKEEGFSGCI